MESSTVSSAFALHMLEGARARGFDADRILAGCGIAPGILHQPRSRITLHQLSRLSESIVDLLDDELYGLLDRPQKRNTYRFMCYAMSQATNVREALHLASDFHNLLDNGLSCAVVDGPAGSAFVLTRRPRAIVRNHYALEQMLLSVHRTLCWLANARLPILRVDLDFPRPEYAAEYRYVFYGAPIHYQQSQCGFHLANSSLLLPNARTASDLKRLLERLPITLMTQTFEATDLPSQVRKWLERRLREDRAMPDITEAADYFQLHPQAMRRRLARDQTTYQDIKTETRRDLAINRVNTHELAIEEIAFQLGFSESSAFVRAFKSWTGFTPLAFRKMGHLEAPPHAESKSRGQWPTAQKHQSPV